MLSRYFIHEAVFRAMMTPPSSMKVLSVDMLAKKMRHAQQKKKESGAVRVSVPMRVSHNRQGRRCAVIMSAAPAKVCHRRYTSRTFSVITG